MRPGRIAVIASLPFLAALAPRHGAPTSPPAPVTFGIGTVTVAQPLPEARIVTDGHPRLLPTIVLTAPRPAPDVPPAHRVARRVTVTAVQPPAAVQGPAVAVTTTYPYADDTTGGNDPWGFTKRQCVSYVAWRSAEVGRPLDNETENWGSALTWDDAARRLGRGVSTRATVGAVAQWDAGEHGAYWSPGATASNGYFKAGPVGHVAWVTRVYSDGSVQVSQYNGVGTRTFSTMHVRAPRYLSL